MNSGGVPTGGRAEPGFPVFKALIVLVFVVTVGAVGFDQYRKWTAAATAAAQPPSPLQKALAEPPPARASRFRCDGRTHCSQMTSCDEAKFFLASCPGTQMDGDGDGTPCEKQWCSR